MENIIYQISFLIGHGLMKLTFLQLVYPITLVAKVPRQLYTMNYWEKKFLEQPVVN